jgi:hypothetical protein
VRTLFVAAHKTLLAQVAAALIACAASVAVIGACADEPAAEPPQPDSGVDDGAVATAICPTIAPEAGAKCVLPEGTTCDFGFCGTVLARCTGGIWRFASNAPPRPLCPDAAPPDDEAECPQCWPEDVACIYGSQDCSAADASANTAVATCLARRWTVEIRPCRDAGADVQGDAQQDAD